MNSNDLDATDSDEGFIDPTAASSLMRYIALDQNLESPRSFARLATHISEDEQLVRTISTPRTIKLLDPVDREILGLEYLKKQQQALSNDFKERLIADGIDEQDVDLFIDAFAKLWTDGRATRQSSNIIQRIKKSVHDHDLHFYPSNAGRFVTYHPDPSILPLFNPNEVGTIFAANSNMMETFIQDYFNQVYEHPSEASINRFYARRGVALETLPGASLKELNYLSSYSISESITEQFSATCSSRDSYRCIFSCPVPALQQRIVAFAPFIHGMTIDQLEIVIAPPIELMPLIDDGIHEGIHEYRFE